MVFSDELLAAEGHYLYSMKNYMAGEDGSGAYPSGHEQQAAGLRH